MCYTHLLWDFNGTLLDDVQIGIQSVNMLLSRRKMPVIETVEQYYRVFGFPIEDYYRRLGFDFERESYDLLAHEWVAEYEKRMADAPLCKGVLQTLQELSGRGFSQLVLSATEQQMLVRQVRSLGIEKYFTEILGLSNIYAHSKIELALSWQRREKPEKVLVIGDTCHDFETAKELKADCVLIACGHQDKQTLCSYGVPVLNDASELPEFLKKGQNIF